LQPIIQNDYKGLEHYIDRHNAYSTWKAKRYLQLRKIGFSNFTLRQQVKYRLLNTAILPFVYFIGSYFLKLGFLDGIPGLIWHFLQGFWYRFLVDAKIYDIMRRAKKENKTISEVIKEHYRIGV